MTTSTEDRKKSKAKKIKREVKAKEIAETAKPNAEKPKSEKPKSPSEEQVLAAMEKGVEYTSMVLRDKLGLDKEIGRDQIRRIMKKLEADGKVVIEQKKGNGKKLQYVFKLKH